MTSDCRLYFGNGIIRGVSLKQLAYKLRDYDVKPKDGRLYIDADELSATVDGKPVPREDLFAAWSDCVVRYAEKKLFNSARRKSIETKLVNQRPTGAKVLRPFR